MEGSRVLARKYACGIQVEDAREQLEDGDLRLGPDADRLHRAGQPVEGGGAVLGRQRHGRLAARHRHRRRKHVRRRRLQPPLSTLYSTFYPLISTLSL